MRLDSQSIPYIRIGAAALLAAVLSAGGGCAGSGGARQASSANPASEQAGNNPEQLCKSAIDDVTRYCAGDNANTGKCSDAKGRSRKYCI